MELKEDERCLQCPCCLACKYKSEFQKIIDLKEIGLVIYRHVTPTIQENNFASAMKRPPENAEEIFILHNTKDVEITSVEFISALNRHKLCCPRCQHIKEHAQRLMNNISAIDKNDIIGICNHCRMKEKSRGICECEEIAKLFISGKTTQMRHDETKKRIQTWLGRIQHLVKEVASDEKDVSKTIAQYQSDLKVDTSKGQRPLRPTKVKEVASDDEDVKKVTTQFQSELKVDTLKGSGSMRLRKVKEVASDEEYLKKTITQFQSKLEVDTLKGPSSIRPRKVKEVTSVEENVMKTTGRFQSELKDDASKRPGAIRPTQFQSEFKDDALKGPGSIRPTQFQSEFKDDALKESGSIRPTQFQSEFKDDALKGPGSIRPRKVIEVTSDVNVKKTTGRFQSEIKDDNLKRPGAIRKVKEVASDEEDVKKATGRLQSEFKIDVSKGVIKSRPKSTPSLDIVLNGEDTKAELVQQFKSHIPQKTTKRSLLYEEEDKLGQTISKPYEPHKKKTRQLSQEAAKILDLAMSKRMSAAAFMATDEDLKHFTKYRPQKEGVSQARKTKGVHLKDKAEILGAKRGSTSSLALSYEEGEISGVKRHRPKFSPSDEIKSDTDLSLLSKKKKQKPDNVYFKDDAETLESKKHKSKVLDRTPSDEFVKHGSEKKEKEQEDSESKETKKHKQKGPETIQSDEELRKISKKKSRMQTAVKEGSVKSELESIFESKKHKAKLAATDSTDEDHNKKLSTKTDKIIEKSSKKVLSDKISTMDTGSKKQTKPEVTEEVSGILVKKKVPAQAKPSVAKSLHEIKKKPDKKSEHGSVDNLPKTISELTTSGIKSSKSARFNKIFFPTTKSAKDMPKVKPAESSRLIKDTQDKLQLRADEEKKKNDEAKQRKLEEKKIRDEQKKEEEEKRKLEKENKKMLDARDATTTDKIPPESEISKDKLGKQKQDQKEATETKDLEKAESLKKKDKSDREKGEPLDKETLERQKREMKYVDKVLKHDDKTQDKNLKLKKDEEENLKKALETADKKIGFGKTDVKVKLPEMKKDKTKPEVETQTTKRRESGKDLVSITKIQQMKPSYDDLILKLVRMRREEGGVRERPPQPQISAPPSSILRRRIRKKSSTSTVKFGVDSDMELDLESILRKKAKAAETEEIIVGQKIYQKKKMPVEKILVEKKPQLFKSSFKESTTDKEPQIKFMEDEGVGQTPTKSVKGGKEAEESTRGVIQYSLSDRTFIDKGWTMLPTEKVVRKMNVYRMRPARPEFDWFEHNKNKRLMTYDTGEKLAEFDDNGRGRWYYKNGRLALDYYDSEDINAQQRFVVYSSGEPDERGRSHPITVLATFDYLGNGIVFDHVGKIRLKYNQTEGVVLDRGIGPVSHWKWHTLNDPPVLQQVMIDTHVAHKDPDIMNLGGPSDAKVQQDNEDMLAIEFDNFIKEKSKKSSQKFKPFQIKMKALKINDQFSLRVLDQATIYLLFRDGTTNMKLNIGMILDHKEIIDTDTAEVGEVSNNLERFPARTDSIAGLQETVSHAQCAERARIDRERRIRPREPTASIDRLRAAASRPLRIPLLTVPSGSTAPCDCAYRSRKPTSMNVYYDTRLI